MKKVFVPVLAAIEVDADLEGIQLASVVLGKLAVALKHTSDVELHRLRVPEHLCLILNDPTSWSMMKRDIFRTPIGMAESGEPHV